MIIAYVDVTKDYDDIALSLGIDMLKTTKHMPLFLLIQESQAFLAPPLTITYKDVAQFIEGEYKNKSVTVWPLNHRFGVFFKFGKLMYRWMMDTVKIFIEDGPIYNTNRWVRRRRAQGMGLPYKDWDEDSDEDYIGDEEYIE